MTNSRSRQRFARILPSFRLFASRPARNIGKNGNACVAVVSQLKASVLTHSVLPAQHYAQAPRTTNMTTRITAHIVLCLLLTTISPTRLLGQTGWGIGVIKGEIYFSDLNRGQVVKLDRKGAKHILLDDIHCHNLAPGFDGFIYAEAVGTNRGGAGDTVEIWRVSSNGDRDYLMPPTSTPLAGVWIARDSAGNSYAWHREGVRISQILKRAPDGGVSVLAGSDSGCADGIKEAAKFSHVGNVAVTASGTVYLTDDGNLRRISPDGKVTTLRRDIVSSRTGGLPWDFGFFNRSQGIAVATVDGKESVFIVDHYNQRIVRWTEQAGSEVIYDTSDWLSRFTVGDLGWFVRGVAVNGSELYVLETFNAPRFLSSVIGTPRIYRILPDGKVIKVATLR
jgi:hypothetical protein